MTRHIKFRVWNGETMVSPDYISREGVAFWKENSITESSKELMQFTGLFDKNGKEIYEGDIIKCIEFSDSGNSRFDGRNSCENELTILVKDIFTLHQFEIEGREFYLFGFQDKEEGYKLYGSGYNPNTYEVIGNIYENPELLSN